MFVQLIIILVPYFYLWFHYCVCAIDSHFVHFQFFFGASYLLVVVIFFGGAFVVALLVAFFANFSLLSP